LFDELIADKLAVSEIMLLLEEGTLTVGEIAEHLGMSRSTVSKHLNSSARQRLIRFNEEQKR
jgi:F420-non-reducing hydrogenase iron-sulfur subunit